MKHILLLSGILSFDILFGQTITKLNEPAIGESQAMYLCDSNASNYASTTGSGVTWDYSKIAFIKGQVRDVKVIDPTTTTHSANYSSATKSTSIEKFITTYWTSTNDSVNALGFVFTEPSLGDVVSYYSTNDEHILNYPFALSNSISDNFAGNTDLVYLGNPFTVSSSGSLTATIDGIGNLVINDTLTINNVVRYKLTETSIASNVPILGNLQIDREHYEYYATSSTLPLFIHSNIKMKNVGSSSYLTNKSIVLSAFQPGSTLGINQLKQSTFQIFPNPASHTINISGEGIQEIMVLDLTGKTLFTTLENKINVTEMQKGIYLLKILSEKGIQLERFEVK